MNNPALADRPLSDMLEMMVHQALISESVAIEFNQLPTEELQRKAVERYLDERQILARMIVSDVTRRTIPLTVTDLEMESAAQIQNRIDQIPPLSWQELQDALIVDLSALRTMGPWMRRHGMWLALIFGTAWILSPGTPRHSLENTIPAALSGVPDQLIPAGHLRKMRTLSVPPESQTLHSLQVHPLAHAGPPPAPKDLVLELVHGQNAVLRWNALPGDAHYNVYWAPAGDPTHFQKDRLSPLSRPSVIWPFPTADHRYLIRVTSLDSEGHESVPSSPLRIDLTPAF